MKSFICLRSMRPWSSRCSAAFSLEVSYQLSVPTELFAKMFLSSGTWRIRWRSRVTYMSIPLILDR